jgi:opacity protein-like surface antigen
MKKIIFTGLTLSLLFLSGTLKADDIASAVTKTTIAAQAVTNKPEAVMPIALTRSAAPVSATFTAVPFIEGVMPPAVEDGAYEDPGEPAPTAEEAAKAVEKKSEARKNKHFTIEQTFLTPSSIGTKLGYFINENWRVAAEYSTISWLIANSSHEKNSSWAVSGNFSPADDDWSPFYGAGFTMMDLLSIGTENNDKINYIKQFTAGYLSAGVSWITDSIFMATIELDLYGGRTRTKKDDITTPANSTDKTEATLSVGIGATVGLCF